MNLTQVEMNLIEVLQSIQSDSGCDASSIVGKTCPVQDLEGFDSMLWPVAIGMLASALNINIPNDENIFLSENGKQRLTISESAARVCKIIGT